MISVITNRQIFEYDIHSLVKAFYGREEVRVSVAEELPKDFSGFFLQYEEIAASWGINRADPNTVAFSVYSEGKLLDTEKEEVSRETLSDRILLKNTVKRCIYRLLARELKKELPWGTLTGIRPVKLVMKGLSEGETPGAIGERLKQVYYVSEPKLSLALEIAGREKVLLLETSGAKGYSLYLGIPFCPTTCLYCSFTSFSIALWRERVADYLCALKREIDETAKLFQGRRLDSIYIGGGTPTTLTADELADLMGYIRDSFDLSGLLEYTIEAGRPDSVTEEKLAAILSGGANRISINPQTMNDETLKRIGRRHTTEEFVQSFLLARKAGFRNINTDLILGLPGEGLSEVQHTFSELSALLPESVTVHSMALKRAAGMAEFLKEHEELSSVNSAEIMGEAEKSARSMGLLPYYLYRQKNMTGNLENVGYAKEGCFGFYNILMIEEIQDIVALGAGTVTKRVYYDPETGLATGRIERCDNVRDPLLYIDRIEEMLDRKRRLFSNGEAG
ncbi:MAG: coproporphyrinogen dehydrogenase HemZ [Lachnospiraceae bacterium]|nr:coproporphyrinogen dehydrogenase HemZ [Lachnospiraceae bacterium]